MASATLDQALSTALKHHQSGQVDQAERIYRAILAQHPDCGDALHLLGLLFFQKGQNPAALELVGKAIELHPGAATFHASLARILQENGKAEEAIASYRRAIELRPDYIEAITNLGGVYFQLRRLDEAAECCRAALRFKPDFAIAWSNLANIFNEQRNFDEALGCAEKALAASRDFPDALAARANSLRELGRVDEAIAESRRAIALKPAAAKIYNNLAIALTGRKRFEEALVALDKAISLQGRWAAPWVNRATTLRDAGRPEEALTAARRALEIDPNLAQAHINLAGTLLILERIDDALGPARRAVELDPNSAQAHATLAWALKDAGDVIGSIDSSNRALELDPTNAVNRSNKVYSLQFDPRADAQSLLAAQKEWDHYHAEPLRKLRRKDDNDRSENRRIRIGYVSPYFFGHAESFFVVPLLEAHHREKFEIHCYSDSIRSDAITARIKRCADAWHNTTAMTHDELAEQIRSDRIDILIDVAMHMSHNRMLTFARKPAPVQVAWLAYPGGTGLDGMDYRITDPWIDPAGADGSCYLERSIRLPHTWACYDPLSEAAPAAPRAPGPIRFGSINNPCKLNEPLLKTWAEVLRAVPDSRLIVQALCIEQRQTISRIFESAGVSSGRLQFLDRFRRPDYLRLYDQIDIGLDPLPYNGITTTCDALWMGVPVITLPGKTAAGRAGVSILGNIGLPELIAKDADDVVRIARDLAGDAAKLLEMRASLRDRMRSSPLMDFHGFARDMEAAYRQMWRT
jgi:protein O-GlcNAc transferase